MSDPDQFLSHVTVVDGHWLWTGTLSSAGYGSVRVNGTAMTAQRRAWELFRGPLESDEVLLKNRELCPHKVCVNPAHWTKEVR